MRHDFRIGSVEDAARSEFLETYRSADRRLTNRITVANTSDTETTVATGVELLALRFAQLDGKQVVQFRPGSYSFNRLPPYGRLDDYRNEIERTWAIFARLTQPSALKAIRLQYIKRLFLPLRDGGLDFKNYLSVSPQLPDQSDLVFASFLNQHTAIETSTQNEVRIVLMTQASESAALPLIFDIVVGRGLQASETDWSAIRERILDLRRLKNVIFANTLTPECLAMYEGTAD